MEITCYKMPPIRGNVLTICQTYVNAIDKSSERPRLATQLQMSPSLDYGKNYLNR